MKVRDQITPEDLERSLRLAAGGVVKMLLGGFVHLEGLETLRHPIIDAHTDMNVVVAIARALAPLKACHSPADRAMSCHHCVMKVIAAQRNREADPQAWIYDDDLGEAMASIFSARPNLSDEEVAALYREYEEHTEAALANPHVWSTVTSTFRKFVRRKPLSEREMLLECMRTVVPHAVQKASVRPN